MKTVACIITAVGIACTGGPEMSPKKESKPADSRRVIMSFETGPGMQQHDSRPCVTLFSDGEVRTSDAAFDGDGHRVLVLEPAVVKRLIEAVEELKAREVKHKTHKHDAKTYTYAAWNTSGERIVLQSGQGEDAWRHPQGDDALRALTALLMLAGH